MNTTSLVDEDVNRVDDILDDIFTKSCKAFRTLVLDIKEKALLDKEATIASLSNTNQHLLHLKEKEIEMLKEELKQEKEKRSRDNARADYLLETCLAQNMKRTKMLEAKQVFLEWKHHTKKMACKRQAAEIMFNQQIRLKLLDTIHAFQLQKVKAQMQKRLNNQHDEHFLQLETLKSNYKQDLDYAHEREAEYMREIENERQLRLQQEVLFKAEIRRRLDAFSTDAMSIFSSCAPSTNDHTPHLKKNPLSRADECIHHDTPQQASLLSSFPSSPHVPCSSELDNNDASGGGAVEVRSTCNDGLTISSSKGSDEIQSQYIRPTTAPITPTCVQLPFTPTKAPHQSNDKEEVSTTSHTQSHHFSSPMTLPSSTTPTSNHASFSSSTASPSSVLDIASSSPLTLTSRFTTNKISKAYDVMSNYNNNSPIKAPKVIREDATGGSRTFSQTSHISVTSKPESNHARFKAEKKVTPTKVRPTSATSSTSTFSSGAFSKDNLSSRGITDGSKLK